MANGSNIFGTSDLQVNYYLSSNPSLLAVLKVFAVVAGHIAGAIAAHDRATKLLPPEHRIAGQLAMMTVMVVYTTGGLFLLFSRSEEHTSELQSLMRISYAVFCL